MISADYVGLCMYLRHVNNVQLIAIKTMGFILTTTAYGTHSHSKEYPVVEGQ